jgi:MYXO-CTERM domain-containing protein
VWTSDPLVQNSVSATTITSTGEDLAWGGEYWARARARDDRGGQSDWSDSHRFRLKINQPPGNPVFDGPCVAATLTEPAAQIVVRNVDDPEGEPVVYEVELFRYDDNPLTSFPVYNTSAPLDTTGTSTTINLDLSTVPNGRYRYFVRAFDGSDASDAIECELTLDVEPAGQPGGCCSTGPGRDAHAVALLALLTLAGVLGRRRRRRVA